MKNLTILLLCLLCSCATMRRFRSVEQSVTDSASHSVTDSMQALQLRYHSASSIDTTIYVAGRIATLVIPAVELQPVYDASGKAVTREYRRDIDGMHIVASLNPDGSLLITATADSLNLVIKGLIREKDSIVSVIARSRTETAQKSHAAEKSTVQSTTKRVGLFGLVTRIVIGAVIGIVVIWVSFKGKAFIKLFKIIKW